MLQPLSGSIASLLDVAVSPQGVGLLVTAALLGIRHGIDWDHIAAITDITSTTATADAGTAAHGEQHRALAEIVDGHAHEHGGRSEMHASRPGAGSGDVGGRCRSDAAFEVGSRSAASSATRSARDPLRPRARLRRRGPRAAALVFGAILPDWVDPIMGRVVGATLVILGIWVFVSLYQYMRYGTEFRLRSRWMLVFDSVRYSWRRFQAEVHGHAHVEPLEMSSYGKRTAFGVGMIHGIGAETGTQVLIIAAVGGAAGAGLGIPMMLAFIVGLLVSNTIVVVVSRPGSSPARRANGSTSRSASRRGRSAWSSARCSSSSSRACCPSSTGSVGFIGS